MAGAIIDEWSPLAFIQSLGGEDGKAPPHSPLYMPLTDQRRLRAYNILAAFMANTRRDYLPSDAQSGLDYDTHGRPRAKAPEATQYREYGDASLVVDALRDLILGESQEVVLGNDEEPADEAIAEWVDDWVNRERLEAKLLNGERMSCGLGDAVYIVGASERAGRPKLRVEDPGFYFPDTQTPVDGWDDEDFPPIVHLLWEWDSTDGKTTWVRRASWRMVRLETAVETPWASRREWTCMYEVVEWKKEALIAGRTVYDTQMGYNPVQVTEPQDLLVDFIPVIHVPNSSDEWGTSILTIVAQLIDDLQSADSDKAIASQTANPLLVVEGSELPTLTGVPGESMSMPPGAKASYIAANLTAQEQHLEGLMKRLAQNTRLGEVLLGRVSPTEVPSGYAMALGFHPARQVMRNGRTVRNEKYPLIIKFAIRMAQAYGQLATKGPTPDIEVALGSSLPSDKATAVESVSSLLTAHGISTTTAVAILQEAGFPIENADEEVRQILAENGDLLVKIVDATGAQGLAVVVSLLEALQEQATPSTEADEPPTDQPITVPPPTDNSGQ